MGNNLLYLKNAQVIDGIAGIKSLVFDKTGTLTQSSEHLSFSTQLNKREARWLYALTGQSNHPSSREINAYLKNQYQLNGERYAISDFKELTGLGVSANIDQHRVKFGSAQFVNQRSEEQKKRYLL